MINALSADGSSVILAIFLFDNVNEPIIVRSQNLPNYYDADVFEGRPYIFICCD